jgi:hypothetical protein
MSTWGVVAWDLLKSAYGRLSALPRDILIMTYIRDQEIMKSEVDEGGLITQATP